MQLLVSSEAGCFFRDMVSVANKVSVDAVGETTENSVVITRF